MATGASIYNTPFEGLIAAFKLFLLSNVVWLKEVGQYVNKVVGVINVIKPLIYGSQYTFRKYLT